MQDQDNVQKILIASRCVQTIGSQRIHLGRFALTRGWAVAFAGQGTSNAHAENLRSEGFDVYPVPIEQSSLNVSSLLRSVWELCRVCRNINPDVFHAFTIKPTIAGLIAAKIVGVPNRLATVAGLGHIFLSSSVILRFLSFLLLRFSLSFAHRVIFYNKADCEEYVRRRIVPERKTVVIPGSGLDTARFPKMPLPNTSATKFVFVGRLLGEKGVFELFEAMRLVKEANEDVEFHIVGDCDPYNPSAASRSLIENLAQEGLFTWHGLLPDVRTVVKACHVVMLPSHREGIPLALLEGGAMGRALIATKVPGCEDVVVPDVTGLLVPVCDPRALAESMLALASDRELVESMGNAAHDDIVARFDTHVVNSQVLDLYRQIMSRSC